MVKVWCKTSDILYKSNNELGDIYRFIMPDSFEELYVRLASHLSDYLDHSSNYDLVSNVSDNLVEHRLDNVEKMFKFLKESTNDEFDNLEIELLKANCSGMDIHLNRENLLSSYSGLRGVLLNSREKYEENLENIKIKMDKSVDDINRDFFKMFVNSDFCNCDVEQDKLDVLLQKFDTMDIEDEKKEMLKKYFNSYINMRINAFQMCETIAYDVVATHRTNKTLEHEKFCKGKMAVLAISDMPIDLIVLDMYINGKEDNDFYYILYRSIATMGMINDYFKCDSINKGMIEGVLDENVVGLGTKSLLKNLYNVDLSLDKDKVNKLD